MIIASCVSDATSSIDPAAAARIVELEAIVAAHEAALAVERALRAEIEAERDRLREAYQQFVLEVELARRRLVVAKAERIDTTQLEQIVEPKYYDASSPSEVAARVADCEIAILNKAKLGADAITGATRLKLIALVATGSDNVDLSAAKERGIAVA